MLSLRWIVPLSTTTLLLVACKDEPPPALAPLAQPVVAPAPPAPTATKLSIVTSSSAVTWTMDAPLEKIYGEVPGGVSGELYFDATDIRKTRGVVRVSLATLALYQQKRDDAAQAYGPKEKVAKQNEHARAWLEISPDTPAELRAAHEVATLSITAVTASGATDLTQLGGPRRVVMAEVRGTFVLHGRQVDKSVPVEVTADYAGERLVSLAVRSLAPLVVGLEEHDVRPREAFGKLAAKTLTALGNKVATAAPVDVVLVARP